MWLQHFREPFFIGDSQLGEPELPEPCSALVLILDTFVAAEADP